MKLRTAVLTAAAWAVATLAHAATFTINHTMNPANVLPSNITGETLATPVSLGSGDTLDLTLTFQGGQIATVTGEDGLWLGLLSNGSADTIASTGTFELLGVNGSGISGPIGFAVSDSFVHVGPYRPAAFYRLDNAPLSFSGIRLIYNVNSGPVRQYQNIFLTRFTGDVTFSPAGVVPEPATWAMMIGGFGLIGGALRRRAAAFA